MLRVYSYIDENRPNVGKPNDFYCTASIHFIRASIASKFNFTNMKNHSSSPIFHTGPLTIVALLYITTRGQVDTGGSIEAGLPPAVVWMQHAAQFDLCQFHHFSHVRALVLQRQLVGVDQNRVQAALEALQNQRVLLLLRDTLLVLHLVQRAEADIQLQNMNGLHEQ